MNWNAPNCSAMDDGLARRAREFEGSVRQAWNGAETLLVAACLRSGGPVVRDRFVTAMGN